MRWKLLLLYMLIIGLAFYVVAASLINLVGDYLFSQRVEQGQAVAERLAIAAASDLRDQDGRALYERAEAAAAEYGGRVLVLDAYGTVQADAYGQLVGARLGHPEIAAVLSGRLPSAHGFYMEDPSEGNWLLKQLGFGGDTSVYGLYVSGIVSDGSVTGAVTLSMEAEDENYAVSFDINVASGADIAELAAEGDNVVALTGNTEDEGYMLMSADLMNLYADAMELLADEGIMQLVTMFSGPVEEPVDEAVMD